MNIRTTLVASALTFSVLFVTVGLRGQNFEGDQRSAIDSLRSINTAEVTYQMDFGKGWSSTLAALEVPQIRSKFTPETGAWLDNAVKSTKKGAYIFTYKAGEPDASGKITTYTVSARRAKWHKGLWSFFSDDSGIIRGTDENRAAKASDPPLH
ncbi:MAG TPA: hypothetical protein VKV95_16505 [Terriglobia bacterium]|nr:hypothetical protein [Terriglobia bacterium]